MLDHERLPALERWVVDSGFWNIVASFSFEETTDEDIQLMGVMRPFTREGTDLLMRGKA